ncbi:MAG TPA: DegT/DnrJ/EryC1/StrS family aminotransferase [Chryseosolibacter sp.]
MLNRLIPIVQKLKKSNPVLYAKLVGLGKRFLGKRLGVYPRLLANEKQAVADVLDSSQWNMAYGKGLAHERLEEAFSEYVGVPHAVAVGSGGMAIQMTLRAFGFQHGDEVIHQVDTCSATAMAVMNAGVTPVFADINDQTFMLDGASVQRATNSQTRGILGTHMWGNPENMKELRTQADGAGLKLIEDACLALGTKVQGKMAGSWGDASVFSFGCIKPIQGGEGGMILTADSALASELRAMRHWGDRTSEFGVRDVTELSWNGRMSEIVAAVVREQLKGYPSHLAEVRERVQRFTEFLNKFEGITLMTGKGGNISEVTFTQAVLKIDGEKIAKEQLYQALAESGIPVWHANFELINSLSFFRNGTWRKWIVKGDLERIAGNYAEKFPAAQQLYESRGIGLAKMNFLSNGNLSHLMKEFERAVTLSSK